MLRPENQTTSRDAIFGDFKVFRYDDIRGRLPMADFFLDIWQQKGGEDRTITRADLSPVEMKKYLEHVVLLDVIRKGAQDFGLLVRLIGGHVAGFYGEITGKDVREMENNKAIERIYCGCGEVLKSSEPTMTIAPAFSPDRHYLEASALYLPIFDEDGMVNKIMVAVHVSAPQKV